MKPEVKDFIVQRLATISAHALSADAKEILRAANEAFVALALDRVWGASETPPTISSKQLCPHTDQLRHHGETCAICPGGIGVWDGAETQLKRLAETDVNAGVRLYAKDDDNGSSELWAKMPDGSTRRVDISPTTNLIGGPGWQKGVLDCIDVLFVRQINGQADFKDAIKQLQSLFARDAVTTDSRAGGPTLGGEDLVGKSPEMRRAMINAVVMEEPVWSQPGLSAAEVRDAIIAEVGMMADARTPEMQAAYDAALAREGKVDSPDGPTDGEG